MAAGVVAGAAGVAADVPGDADDDAPEVRCFLLFLGALASIVQSGVRACAEASVFHSRPRRVQMRSKTRVFFRALGWRSALESHTGSRVGPAC